MPDKIDLSTIPREELANLLNVAKRQELLSKLREVDPEAVTRINFGYIRKEDGFSDSFGDSWADSFADSWADSAGRRAALQRLKAARPEQLTALDYSTEGRIAHSRPYDTGEAYR